MSVLVGRVERLSSLVLPLILGGGAFFVKLFAAAYVAV